MTQSTLEPTLPRAAYVDPAFFAREKEQIFCREWFCVGRTESLPNPGDYLLVEVAGESIIVTRTRSGELRAHYNVCRHRGSQLVLEKAELVTDTAVPPTGHFRGVIHCPYHAWSYELDGRVRSTPFLDETDGLCRDEFSLYPVGLETWGGFIFLHLTPGQATQSLAEQLGPIPDRVHRYPLADLQTAQRLVYNVAANWKVIVENYNECYHCGPVHPELCRIVPAFKERGGSNLEWEDGIPQAEGTYTFTLTGTTNRAPFPGLSREEQIRHKGELVYPNLMVSLSCDHVAVFTLWPMDVGHTAVVCDFLFHPDEMAKPDFDPRDAVEFWDLVNRQDWVICEAVQRGMSSRVFQHGYYAPMEDLSLDIRRYLGERLEIGD